MSEGDNEPITHTVVADRVFTESDRRKLFERSPTAEIIISGVPAKCVIDTGRDFPNFSGLLQ